MPTPIDYSERIPNNVGLAGDRRLRRALEGWQPKFLDWWRDLGPALPIKDVYLRTAVAVGRDGWAHFAHVPMDHVLIGTERSMTVVEDGRLTTRSVPTLNALNLDLRDEYIADSARRVKRWNQVLAEAGLPHRLSLPHEGFHRKVGAYAGHHLSPEGEVLDAATWESRSKDWLPTSEDRAAVASLMHPEYEPGRFAAWIAPPRTGINEQPVEFDYVHLAEEGVG